MARVPDDGAERQQGLAVAAEPIPRALTARRDATRNRLIGQALSPAFSPDPAVRV
jgi:hypothetical protein